MATSIRTRFSSVHKTGGIVISAVALAAAISLSGPRSAEGNPPDDGGGLKTKAEIESLAVCYAAAADAIGRGDVEEGRQISKTCFTDDMVFEAFLPNQDPNGSPAYRVIGPDAWTDSGNDTFSAMGYTATQHHIGNVKVIVQGDTATMVRCVTAVHVVDWSSTVDLVTATYTDDVVRTPDGWRIAHVNLQATSALRLIGSPMPLP